MEELVCKTFFPIIIDSTYFSIQNLKQIVEYFMFYTPFIKRIFKLLKLIFELMYN